MNIRKRPLLLIMSLVALVIIAMLSSNFSKQSEAVVSPTPSAANANKIYFWVQAGEKVTASMTKIRHGHATNYGVNITKPTVYDANGNALATSAGMQETTAINTKQTLMTDRVVTAAQAGIWTLDFSTTGTHPTNIQYAWEVTVKNANNVVQTARAWSQNYSHHTLGQADSDSVTFGFWAVTDTGHVYKIDLRKYNGQSSRLFVDSLGVYDPATCASAYQSVPVSGTPYKYGDASCTKPFRIFFENPMTATTALPSAPQKSMDGNLVVRPALLAPESIVSSLFFEPNSSKKRSGKFKINFHKDYSGNYKLQIDTNNNGSYTDAVDKTVTGGSTVGQTTEIVEWDGVNGNGTTTTSGAFRARILIEKFGEMHFIQSDVEGHVGGAKIEALSPIDATRNRFAVSWDDTPIVSMGRATTTPVIKATNVNSSVDPTHGWANNTNGWGNNGWIDTWTYAAENYTAKTLAVSAENSLSRLSFEGTAVPDKTNPTLGETVTITYTLKNTSNSIANLILEPNIINDTDSDWYFQDVPVGGTVSVTRTYVITQEDIDNGEYDHSFFGEVSNGDSYKGEDIVAKSPTRDVPITGTINKVATGFQDFDGNGVLNVGDKVNYTYTISNTGSRNFIGSKVNDPTAPGATFSTTSLRVNTGETKTVTAVYTIRQADLNSGGIFGDYYLTITNDDDFRLVNTYNSVLDTSGGVTLPAIAEPTYQLVISKQDDTRSIKKTEGDGTSWDYIVTNVGTANATGIVITDDKGIAVTCPKTTLTPGESMTCTGSGTITYN